jgi:hypothetical protein
VKKLTTHFVAQEACQSTLPALAQQVALFGGTLDNVTAQQRPRPATHICAVDMCANAASDHSQHVHGRWCTAAALCWQAVLVALTLKKHAACCCVAAPTCTGAWAKPRSTVRHSITLVFSLLWLVGKWSTAHVVKMCCSPLARLALLQFW